MSLENGLQWVESELLASIYDRAGLAGEQYRKMGLRLEGLRDSLDGTLRVILVTSPLMGEGKTATAANLAVALANTEGRRVALVDCDHINPRVWTLFATPPKRGFMDVLMSRTAVEEVAVRTSRIPLDVLALPRASEARIDILPVERVKTAFGQLRERYDFVVCDGPPILPVADTAALARLSDGIVVVVRAGMTPRHAVGRALESIEKKKLIGFVLNGVTGRAMDPYYYYPYRGEGGGGQGARKGKNR